MTEVEIMRLKRQISRQNREYQQLQKKYNRINKARVTSTSASINNMKKAWKSQHNASSSTPKPKKKKKKKTTPKLMAGFSAPVRSNANVSTKSGPPKFGNHHGIARYNKGFGIKIKGLSTLNLFSEEEYEEEKLEETMGKEMDDEYAGNEQKMSNGKRSPVLDQSVVDNVDIESDEFSGHEHEESDNSNGSDKVLKPKDD